MILKSSPFSIQDKDTSNIGKKSSNYPTLDDLMTEQNIASNKEKTVHRRRDLDSLG